MEQGVWQEIEQLYQKFQKLGISESVDYDKYYLYSLITHSTAIEGSTLTELDTQLLFDEGVTAKGKPLVVTDTARLLAYPDIPADKKTEPFPASFQTDLPPECRMEMPPKASKAESQDFSLFPTSVFPGNDKSVTQLIPKI